MEKLKKDKFQWDQLLVKLVIAYFIFGSIFITFRLLVLGSASSTTIPEYILSLLPEIFILIIIFLVIRYRSDSHKISFTELRLFDYLVLGYIFTNVILGVFLSGNIILALHAIRLTYIPMLFYFIARLGIRKNLEDYEGILTKIMNWYIIVAIAGVLLYFFMPDLMKRMIEITGSEEQFYYIKRMCSVFWTPVVFGTFMCFFSLFSYYKLIRNNGYGKIVIFSFFWGCLFLSVSRGANVVFFIGMITLTIVYSNYRAFLKGIAGIAIVLTILLFYNYQVFNTLRFIPLSTIDLLMLKEDQTRVFFWTEALNEYKRNPMGYGLGKAGHIGERFFEKGSLEASTYSTDGWYLKLANETGVWGLISYFFLALVFLIQAFNYWKRNKRTFFTFLFLVFILVGIHNLVSNVIDYYTYSSLYWLIIGFTQNCIHNKKDE
ncbi:O-antigen ligase family protein [Bacteroidota bacterium]